MPPASSARTTSATATSILPTAHGFDEFFGNLYHLNAEEEPENPDYPKNPEFRKKFGPRGVHASRPQDGKIENTGPLNTKRMETVDEEFLAGAKDFINRQHKANKPWFCYFNSTRMHIFTHLKAGVARQDRARHLSGRHGRARRHVGELLKLLDDLGVADNTIVVYTTDNGAEVLHLARWRHDAVQGRKGHQLGRRLPRAVRDALAGRDQARNRRQRHLRARRLHPDLRGGQWRSGPRREAEEGLQRSTARTSRFISTATTCCRSSKAR